MKTAVFLLVCFLGSCFAAHVQSSGEAWQGTWSEGKRNFGGNMYICVDQENNVAWGSYSGVGLFSGALKGADFDGQWFEAGYDRPFGPFSLTLSGTSFSGSWSYYNNTNADSTETFAWSGTRSASDRPSAAQCITPSKGVPVTGTYANVEHICYENSDRFQNTNLPGVFGNFQNFAVVGGYSPDGGRSVLMSDFVYRSGDSGSLRPETSNSFFGPCPSGDNCNGPNTGDNRENVQTSHIVIGAAIDESTFCAFFWEGFYNDQISDEAICFKRTSLAEPAAGSCGSEAVIAAARHQDLGNTELLLSEIQRALDALTLPPVVIVPGPFDGDDDNYSSDYFQNLFSSGFSPASPDSPVSTGNSPVSPNSPVSTGNSPASPNSPDSPGVSTGSSDFTFSYRTSFTSLFTSTSYTTGETSFFSTLNFTPNGGLDFDSGSFASSLVVPLATVFVVVAMAF